MVFHNTCVRNARVVELVDTLDLGSSAAKAWGFESPLSYQSQTASFSSLAFLS